MALIRLFPTKSGFIESSANSVAVLAGIGVDYKYRRHLSFRMIQADYGYTRLPNLAGNDQNLLRISTGITIHLESVGAKESGREPAVLALGSFKKGRVPHLACFSRDVGDHRVRSTPIAKLP